MIKSNPYAGVPMEQLPVQRPLQQNKQAARHAHHLSGREQTELTSADAIRNQAGVRDGVTARFRSLMQRMAVPVRVQNQRYVPLKRSKGGKTDKVEHDEDPLFLAPIQDTLDTLSEDGGRESQHKLEAQLEQFFEPLQRYHVLFEALQQLEDEDMPSAKKKTIRRALNTMMSRLVEQHPHEMRRALQESDEMVATLDAMSEDMPTSVRDLRFLIGAKAKGNTDTPLSPLTMLKALIKNFGSDKCLQAMSSLRSRMMAGF